MRGACRKRVRYWFLDYGEIAFVLSILIMTAILIVWMLILLLTPKTVIAGDIVNFRTARRWAPVILHSDIAVSRDSVPVVKVLLMEVSAYSPSVQECDSDPLTTASGKRVYVGGIASDWSVLPCGSIIIIPNYNNGSPCTVIDQGGAIQGNKLDVFMWSESDARQWGRRRNVKVQILYVPKEK